jgi:ribosomal-protein-serine acetyltransferase
MPVIHLRPFHERDARAVYEAVQESAPDISYWMPGLHADLTLADIGNYIAAQTHLRAAESVYAFAIVDEEETFLGGCGLSHIVRPHGFANVFYWIRRSRRGQGIAAAAVRELARIAFTETGLRRVEIVVAVENAPSIRVAEKAGAQWEGRLRNRIAIGARVHDAFLFSLIPSDLNLPSNAGSRS